MAFHHSVMTPGAISLPFGLTSAEQSDDAQAMILAAREALDLAEAEFAALSLAQAFEEHPRLLSVTIKARDQGASPFQNGQRVELRYQAVSDIEGGSDDWASGSWLDHDPPDALTAVMVEAFERETIRKAGSRWLSWLSAKRGETLLGRTLLRPSSPDDGVAGETTAQPSRAPRSL